MMVGTLYAIVYGGSYAITDTLGGGNSKTFNQMNANGTVAIVFAICSWLLLTFMNPLGIELVIGSK